MPTTNEREQPIRLTIPVGGQLRTLQLTGTVWGAHSVTGPAGGAPVRVGRAKHGGREYSVRWSESERVWLHVGTPMQYDANERGE